MGGIRIFIEGQLIDASIRKRLTDLAERIKQRTREEESVEEEKKDAIESAIEEEIKQHQNELAYTYYGTVTQVGDGIAKIFGLDNCMAGELLNSPTRYTAWPQPEADSVVPLSWDRTRKSRMGIWSNPRAR